MTRDQNQAKLVITVLLKVEDEQKRLYALAALARSNVTHEHGSIMTAKVDLVDSGIMRFIINDAVSLQEIGEYEGPQNIHISKRVLVALLNVCANTCTTPIIAHTHPLDESSGFPVSFSCQDWEFMKSLINYAHEVCFEEPIAFWLTDGQTTRLYLSCYGENYEIEGTEDAAEYREFNCSSI